MDPRVAQEVVDSLEGAKGRHIEYVAVLHPLVENPVTIHEKRRAASLGRRPEVTKHAVQPYGRGGHAAQWRLTIRPRHLSDLRVTTIITDRAKRATKASRGIGNITAVRMPKRPTLRSIQAICAAQAA